MKEIKNEIWILADNRAGNYSQAVGLADELGLQSKIVNVSYGFFAVLPNLFLGKSLMALTHETKEILNKFDYFPKIIISAGRRTASVASHIKSQSHNRTQIIQIMNPGANHAYFDFIILPRHDRIKKSYNNVIRSIGALTKVSERAVNFECQKFANLNSAQVKIALLVGGDSKSSKFDEKSALDLINSATKIAKNMKAELLVLTSRRSGEKITEIISNVLKKSKINYKFFDFASTKKEENPYMAILGFADYFIVSGDSVSMISEVCSTSKPVYIFDQEKISSKKHRKFHRSLFNGNYAKKFDLNAKILEKFSVKRLNETRRIAGLLKSYFR